MIELHETCLKLTDHDAVKHHGEHFAASVVLGLVNMCLQGESMCHVTVTAAIANW